MQSAVATPMAGQVAILPNDQSGHLYPGRFKVLGVDTVVADQRISQGHQLPGVGRVGEYLLITRHAGVEHHFSEAFDPGAKANTLVNRAVFQDQIGWLAQFSAPVR